MLGLGMESPAKITLNTTTHPLSNPRTYKRIPDIAHLSNDKKFNEKCTKFSKIHTQKHHSFTLKPTSPYIDFFHPQFHIVVCIKRAVR